jgi:hypothetical protein
VPLRTPGTHTLCTYAINVGDGATNTQLGCRTTSVEAVAFDPTGSPDPLQFSGPVITVAGYAVDPDAVSLLQVHVYVDGVGRAVLLANGASAPDPADGLRYQGDVQLAVGTHSVCAYAINQGQGTTNPQLACQEAVIAVSAYNPVGALTSVTASGGQVTVAGWASDPDTTGPLTVHTYVDGVGVAILTADQTASGVTGPHAYRVQLPQSAGTHQVCTYGINVGVGTTNTHLGCITVNV